MKYPKPGDVGGRLIREVVGSFKRFESAPRLPIGAHILIAVSGGMDSMALARLLVRYGRRVGSVSQMRLVHINHGWRGKESDADEAFVRKAAKRWRVPISVFRLKPDTERGRSPEEAAREQRKEIFDRLAKRYRVEGQDPWIFTAHHADDLAETLVWRFFTGALETHGGGILFRQGQELRPLLRIRKRELAAFLKEEGESWCEDRTNFEGKLLRSRLRLELMPMIEYLFPRAVENLVRYALEAQTGEKPQTVAQGLLLSAAGVRTRKAHWDWLKSQKPGSLSLPEGWVLRSEKSRWVLEKPVTPE